MLEVQTRWCPGIAWPPSTANVKFVTEATKKGGAYYAPPAERIAIFDNDGTLWAEQPFYLQLAFALDRVKALGAQHPEWQDQEPFKSALTGVNLPGLGPLPAVNLPGPKEAWVVGCQNESGFLMPPNLRFPQ